MAPSKRSAADEGGAASVVVNDARWTMINVQIQRFGPRAELIKGFHKQR
jgi:D-aminopeptidase